MIVHSPGTVWYAFYDGYCYTHCEFASEDSTSFSDDRLEYLYVDRIGTLWVGTWGGLNRYDEATV